MGASSNKKNKEEEKKKPIDPPRKLTKKQTMEILKQQAKSLCQITTNTCKGTGFLCKIPNPVLITNNHVLNEDKIKPGEEIKIYFTDEKDNKHYKTIKIDETRVTYTVNKIGDEVIDTTIIEMRKDEDKLDEEEFMEIDKELMIDQVKNAYEAKDVYLIHYYDGKEISLSIGIINEVKKGEKSYTLLHTCDTNHGSSGGPIILYSHKVVGLHREFLSNENFKRATLLQYPIKEFLKVLEQKKLCDKNKNKNKNDFNENEVRANEENKINDGKKIGEDNLKINDEENYADKIKIIYKVVKEEDGINIFGRDFVENNNSICKMIINKDKYDISSFIKYDEYRINKNNGLLTIILTGINSIIDASYMFYNCTSLNSLPDISKWNTINVNNMSYMFCGCSSLNSLPDISKWNTINVNNMSYMFCGCSSLNSLPDISKWNTINVNNMSNIFRGCSSLQYLPDISKWNTKNVENMNSMFYGCSLLQNLPDISKWDIKNVENMSYMFFECGSIKSLPDNIKWNTKNVKKKSRMFN